MSKAISDVIDNTKEIFMTDSALSTLLDFERVLDELDIYVYKNWKEGYKAYIDGKWELAHK